MKQNTPECLWVKEKSQEKLEDTLIKLSMSKVIGYIKGNT
jgi:hypothetical protein